LSGQSYGEFVKQNIFDPPGLNDTGHDGNALAVLSNKASGYAPAGLTDFENVPFLDWSIKTGNGSIYSTVEDLYRWDRSLYTDKILKKSSRDQMFNNGYGWFAGKRLNRNVVRMNGRSPGFNSEMQRYVDDDVCIIVLARKTSTFDGPTESAADAANFVCYNCFAIARTAENDATLAFATSHGFRRWTNEFGIIDLRIAVSAEIMDVMAFGQQELLNLLFVFEAGVIAG